MARLNRRREEVDLWPGFVDALSCMLLVLIFLLTLFAMMHMNAGKMPAPPIAERPPLPPLATIAPSTLPIAPAPPLATAPVQTEALRKAEAELASMRTALARTMAERDAYHRAAQMAQAQIARQRLPPVQVATIRPTPAIEAKTPQTTDKKGEKPANLGSDFIFWINVD